MDGDFFPALVRLLIFFPLVLGLAYVTVRYGLGRATGRVAGPGQLELVARLPLNSKTALAVVRCGGRYFLIGQGEGAPVLLAELPDYPVVPEAGEVAVEICSLPSLAGRDGGEDNARRVPGAVKAAPWQGSEKHGC